MAKPADTGARFATPIEHVVIIVQENKTYDGHFGKLGRGDGDPTLPLDSDPPGVAYPWDPTHGHWWSAKWAQWNDYRAQLDRADIPLYYQAADDFALCDTAYSEIDGPSTWNHAALFAADSHGWIDNRPGLAPLRWLGRLIRRDPSIQPPFDDMTLPNVLEDAGLTWRSYGEGAMQYYSRIKDSPCNVPTADFITDARNGTLPTVSWVHPDSLSQTEHAPWRVANGMMWTFKHIQALVDGGLWGKTAVFVVWDDWGGNADHVPAPKIEGRPGDPTDQYRLGKRVPLLCLSPYAKPAYLSSESGRIKSFRSIPKFIETIFGLASVDQRDAAADDMLDCFDFTQTPLPPPRTRLRAGELRTQPVLPARKRAVLTVGRVFQANVKLKSMQRLEMNDRVWRHLPLVGALATRAFERIMGLRNPRVASLSRQGWPGTPLGVAWASLWAIPMTVVMIPVRAVAVYLVAQGITGLDPAGAKRRKLHAQVVQRNQLTGYGPPDHRPSMPVRRRSVELIGRRAAGLPTSQVPGPAVADGPVAGRPASPPVAPRSPGRSGPAGPGGEVGL